MMKLYKEVLQRELHLVSFMMAQYRHVQEHKNKIVTPEKRNLYQTKSYMESTDRVLSSIFYQLVDYSYHAPARWMAVKQVLS